MLLEILFGFLTGVAALAADNSTSPPPPLLLVSFDGFRADYLKKFPMPNLEFLYSQGVLVEQLTNVFITKTFPNHYSLVPLPVCHLLKKDGWEINQITVILVFPGDRAVRRVSRHRVRLHVRPRQPQALRQHQRLRSDVVERGGAHLAHGLELRLQDGDRDVARLRRDHQEPHSDTLLSIQLSGDLPATPGKCHEVAAGRRKGRKCVMHPLCLCTYFTSFWRLSQC